MRSAARVLMEVRNFRNLDELETIVESKHRVVTAGMSELISERQTFLAKASK